MTHSRTIPNKSFTILISDTGILKGSSSSLSCPAYYIVRVSILKITVVWVCSVFTGDDYDDDDRYIIRLVRGLAAVYRVLTTFADEESPAAIKRYDSSGVFLWVFSDHVNGTCVATAGLSITCECLRTSAVEYIIILW